MAPAGTRLSASSYGNSGMSWQLPACIFSNRFTLSGGRSSRGKGMRRSISRTVWPRLVTSDPPAMLSGAGADHLLQRGMIQVHLDLVHFVPRKPETLELALERGLALRLVDG